MRHTRTIRAVSTAFASIALVAALSACSGSGGSKDAGGLDYEDSPLGKMLYGKQLNMSDDELEAKSNADSKKMEKIIAECMSKEGFEYKPVDTSGQNMMSADDWKPDDRDWVAKYGYGAVDSPASESAGGADSGDPNQPYVDSLSETERNSYYETLYGPQPTEEEMAAMEAEGSEYEYDWKKSGCQGKASHEVWGEDGMGGTDDQFKELTDQINAFYTDMYEGDALKELNAKWAACMEEKGNGGFKSPNEAQQSVYEAIGNHSESQQPADGSEPATEAPDPKDDPELKKIKDDEIKLALVDLDCREKTDYKEQALKTQFALEEKFIKEHKAELEKYKAHLEQQ